MLSRSKAPVQNRLPDLTIDLATEVSSTNKTDVKSHNPGPSSFCNGPATLHNGERSIIPLHRCGDCNRRFPERGHKEARCGRRHRSAQQACLPVTRHV